MNFRRMLVVLLKLEPGTYESDLAVVNAVRKHFLLLPEKRVFDGIFLTVPVWQEKPDARKHPLVLQLVEFCQSTNVHLVWCRRHFPAHSSIEPYWQAGCFSVTHHVATVRMLRLEADILEIPLIGSNIEPYGRDNPDKILQTGLTDDQLTCLDYVASEAERIAGPLDYLWPADSSDSRSWKWRLRKLSSRWLSARTYGIINPLTDSLGINPPKYWPHRIHGWGSAIGDGWLTPQQFLALDSDQIQERFPECELHWAWMDYGKLPEILDSLTLLSPSDGNDQPDKPSDSESNSSSTERGTDASPIEAA